MVLPDADSELYYVIFKPENFIHVLDMLVAGPDMPHQEFAMVFQLRKR